MADVSAFNGTCLSPSQIPTYDQIMKYTANRANAYIFATDTCNPTYLNYADVPATYNASATPLCGLSYPSSLLPSSNFSACCASNISTSNACFQSCSPRGEWDTGFSECVYENLMNGSGSVEVWCNAVAQGFASGTAPGSTARLGWMSLALLVVAGCSVLL